MSRCNDLTGSELVAIFSHARAAFRYGLQQLPMGRGQAMLIPDYNCEVVLHPLEDLGIRVIFYPVNDQFVPDWDSIEKLQIDESADAFLLVHYFGQPQEIVRAKEFCSQHEILLIEDNAHGHGGMLNSQPLGSFGDMGFSSPRKQMQSASGGMLHLHGKPVESIQDALPVFPVSKTKELLSQTIRHFPRLKPRLRRMIRPKPDFSNPSAFPEIRMGYFMADTGSEQCINEENLTDHAKARRDNWRSLSSFVIENGLRPVWTEPHPEACLHG